MLAPGKIQCNLAALAGRYDAAGEHARAVVTGLALHLQNPHARVVVVHHLALGRLPDAFVVGRFQDCGHVFDNLPLRRRRQRDPQYSREDWSQIRIIGTFVFDDALWIMRMHCI